MKTIASKIWNTYDNTYGYVNEKLDRINSIDNIQDNEANQTRFYILSKNKNLKKTPFWTNA